MNESAVLDEARTDVLCELKEASEFVAAWPEEMQRAYADWLSTQPRHEYPTPIDFDQ